MLTKAQTTYKNKKQKDLTESQKVKYFTWIKENKGCIVCGKYPEIHHITNKSIKGQRRLHSRVVPLCFDHHSAQSEYFSVHKFPDEFYELHGGLKLIITKSEEIYEEFLNEQE